MPRNAFRRINRIQNQSFKGCKTDKLLKFLIRIQSISDPHMMVIDVLLQRLQNQPSCRTSPGIPAGSGMISAMKYAVSSHTAMP